MTILGLILNFLGSIFLIKANVKVNDDGVGHLTISTTSKRWQSWGLWFFVFGFLLQLIAKVLLPIK